MPNSLNKLYIGTMSGTSFDGIDVCAISVRKKIDLVHFSSFKYPPKLRKKIAAVIEDQILSLKDYGELDSQIGLAFAKAINKFIKQNNFSTSQIMAIGLLTGMLTSPSLNNNFSTKPSSTASTSIVALSVSISAIISPAFTVSPTFTNHWLIIPSVIVGDKAGISIFEDIIY